MPVSWGPAPFLAFFSRLLPLLVFSWSFGGPGTLQVFQYWGSGPLMYCWSWADWTSRVRLRVERLARLRPVLAPSEALAPRRLQPWTGSPALSPRAGRFGPADPSSGRGLAGCVSPRRFSPRIGLIAAQPALVGAGLGAALRGEWRRASLVTLAAATCFGSRLRLRSETTVAARGRPLILGVGGAVAAPNGAAAGLRPSAGIAGGRSGVLVGILRGGPVWRLGTSPEACRAQAVVRGGARRFAPRGGARSGPMGLQSPTCARASTSPCAVPGRGSTASRHTTAIQCNVRSVSQRPRHL